MIRSFLLVLLLAAGAPASSQDAAPKACPPFGAARCPAQRRCGRGPQHNFAYALRVGHLDYDPASGLLYNPGKHGHDWKRWEYFEAPDFNDHDAWCLETCGLEDPGKRCNPPPKRVRAPEKRPQHPTVVRCFMGDPSGGIDWTQYMGCGAPAKSTAAVAAASVPGSDAECTLGDSRCVCVKGVPLYEKYETAAAAAVSEAFPGLSAKPAGLSDPRATARVCKAYNRRPSLGSGTSCRASDNEIVLEDPRPPIPGFVTVAVGIIKPDGAFGSRAVAACQRGVQ